MVTTGRCSSESNEWGPLCYSGRTRDLEFKKMFTTIFSTSYHTIIQNRFHNFSIGNGPKFLEGGRTPNKKDQKKLNSFQNRLERSPIKKAYKYQRQMKELGCKSIREFARKTGLDWSNVSPHLKLLNLPSPILEYLKQNQTPKVLGKCNLDAPDKSRNFRIKQRGDSPESLFPTGRLREIASLKDVENSLSREKRANLQKSSHMHLVFQRFWQFSLSSFSI